MAIHTRTSFSRLFIATLEARGGIINQFKAQALTVWSAV